MQSNFTQKVSGLLASKLQAQSGARPDMYLSDSVPVSASASKVLIGFTPRFGQPTTAQVVAFVTHKFKGELDPRIETLTVHASNDGRKAGVSLVVAPKRVTMDIAEKQNMIAVSSTLFMDQKIGANWQVCKQPDGTEYFECVRGENVQELINTAIASQGALAGMVRFNDHDVTASIEVSVGDFVEFYTDQGIRRGDVTKVGTDGKVSILADDRQWVVESPAVRKILRLNPKAEDAKQKQIEDFYKLIWGPEFAKKFVENK